MNASHCAPCLVTFSAECSCGNVRVFFYNKPTPAEHFNRDNNVRGIVWNGVVSALTNNRK